VGAKYHWEADEEEEEDEQNPDSKPRFRAPRFGTSIVACG
jgi:hypothetical protein